jgi:rSAM/selenodomain-associated transferase 2
MISVIIPTYNEETALPATLTQLLAQPGEYEVVVVDGGSQDRTCELINNEPRVHVLSAPKGRARQMNRGARHARGEWILFLHADTILPAGALRRLNNMEADDSIQAGGFLHQFAGNDWRLKLLSLLNNFRCTRSRIIYGDQALFVRRSVYEQLGGFPNLPILEDVAFCERLLKITTPLILSPPAITDGRKFLKMGVWRSFLRILLIILHVEYRLPTLPRAFFQDIR